MNSHPYLKLAFKNRTLVEKAPYCGCYFCRSQFSSIEIREYCDSSSTALCPKCGVDSVVPQPENLTSGDFAEELYRAKRSAMIVIEE
jgi:rRNA maturation protein Nop10